MSLHPYHAGARTENTQGNCPTEKALHIILIARQSSPFSEPVSAALPSTQTSLSLNWLLRRSNAQASPSHARYRPRLRCRLARCVVQNAARCDPSAHARPTGSYGGEDSPNDISRGVFAAEVGIPRLVKMLDKYQIKASFFVPGHTLDSFPEECALVRDAGHEFGLHGESPAACTSEKVP